MVFSFVHPDVDVNHTIVYFRFNFLSFVASHVFGSSRKQCGVVIRGGDRGSREFREFRESLISRKFFPGTPGNDSIPGKNAGNREPGIHIFCLREPGN